MGESKRRHAVSPVLAGRTELAIRAERERWIKAMREHRRHGDRDAVEGLVAITMVQTLTWVLGEIESPTHRVRID